jgi:hypothetical protein
LVKVKKGRLLVKLVREWRVIENSRGLDLELGLISKEKINEMAMSIR